MAFAFIGTSRRAKCVLVRFVVCTKCFDQFLLHYGSIHHLHSRKNTLDSTVDNAKANARIFRYKITLHARNYVIIIGKRSNSVYLSFDLPMFLSQAIC